MDGALLADGDLIQTARGEQVTARLVFRFKDGSLHDETAVFSQRGYFDWSATISCRRAPPFRSRST